MQASSSSASLHDYGSMRSLLGAQADSRKESAPSFGFGTAGRTTTQVCGLQTLSPKMK